MTEGRLELLARLNRQFAAVIALHEALGVELGELGDGSARMRLPYNTELVGDTETGALHPSAVTLLVDGCCGAAAFMALPEPQGMATLDLRIDHFRAAGSGVDLLCEARCVRITRSVAFLRATVYTDDPDDPVAAGTATYMLGTRVKK